LQAVLYLALKRDNEMTSIKELTKKLEIPYHFVAKILQDLTRKGILISHKGPAGGFRLAVPAKEITLIQVVEAIDGLSIMEKCVLGFPTCSENEPCAVHKEWNDVREKIRKMLATKSILEMAGTTQKHQYKMLN
jgi:Rrf2 family iron-sulfur cluster assembly transcriptional regulator